MNCANEGHDLWAGAAADLQPAGQADRQAPMTFVTVPAPQAMPST
jgi:hypothetical protein